MKRFFALLMMGMLLITTSGCALEDTVKQGTYDVLNALTGQDMEAPQGEQSGSHSTRPGGSSSFANADGSYWEHLENEWKNAPAEGYVWTITINDADVIDVLGLASAKYEVNLSASHIGEDMYGAYFGDFGFESSTDLGGLESVVTAWSGSMEYDADVWFKNSEFMFSLDKYDEAEEEAFSDAIVADSEFSGMSAAEQMMMEGLLGEVYKSEEKAFEKQSEPSALWWDFDMLMTDGDMGASLGFYGISGGTVSGYAETDKTGRSTEAVVHSIAGTFRESSELQNKFNERYGDDDEFHYPMPYTLKVYPGNEVIMTFYSLDGSPVTIKCYGTIDKVPVEDTLELPNQ